MKIMTFNTQHCLSFQEDKIDFELMAQVIKRFEPDVVGLNEMRSKGNAPEFEDQTAILSELTGLKHYYFAKAIDVGEGNPYGNALLSKVPIVSAQTIPIPDPKSEEGLDCVESRCLLKVQLENGMCVLVTHFGLSEQEQKNAVQTALENMQNEKCVFMGDFNVEPESAILNPIRVKMKDVADLFAKPLHSYPSDDPVCKIDYIFVSPDITVQSADIPAVVASDHRPHIADICLS
jgi:endonuclease/exonuclease/phosphatase family metal-dependent hydrolase